MNFDDLLSRADDEVLQTLLGGPTIRLLRLLDPQLITPQYLRGVLLGLRSREDLLARQESRTLLLDLLRPADAARLATTLGIPPADDAYNALRALRIRRGSNREQALFDFFDLVPPKPEEPLSVPSQCSISGELPLFKHQRSAARAVHRALEEAPHRVLLHMPTGAGKTRTSMQIIANHLRMHEPALVIWLAYSEELCEQAASEFDQTWRGLGDRELKLHRFWAAHELQLDDARDGVLVASLTKLYRAALNELGTISTLAGRCTLVIIDEAHQSVAETYQLILDTLVTQGRSAALLGLTATPGRTWNDVAADTRLAEFFGHRKVSLHIEGYANPIDYLVEEGYLARVQFRTLMQESGFALTSSDLQKIERELDIPKEVLERIAASDQRNLLILIEAERLIARHQRLLIFAASVDHARLLAAVLRARGHDAAAVTGETPSLERARLIERYKESSGEPRILCNFGVLTTGFDAPQTSAALIARPTRSLVLYSQMVGRAIRGLRVGGNANAEIVTVVDTELQGFGNVAEAFANWEDVWRDE